MKKVLLPLAIAASLPMSAMAVGPVDGTIYGKLNVSVVNVDEKPAFDQSNDVWELSSNASRLGVKGKSELSEGLYAIYKAEFEMYLDDGKSSSSKGGDTFEQRNIYVGLTGGFGTVFAGRHDTPLKLAQAKVDLFGDQVNGDIKNWMSGETRGSNVINYTTPNMSGFSASLMTIVQEGDSDDKNGNANEGLGDSLSGSVSFKQDGLYAALAFDKNVKSGSFEKKFLDITRFVASYNMDDLTVGGLYQTAKEGESYGLGYYDEKSYMLSASYKIDKIKLKVQLGKGEQDDKAGTKEDTKVAIFGADYKLAKSTKLFTYYSRSEVEENGVSDGKENVFALGMEHKF